ncbi:helix-turn-helix domain-containing protein [Halanaerobacter jeridensis]|uniref:Cytoskeletal protein RodZ n=1 Tax=Halanaerobacter jeridensis TaxID=706427 RepID=A0A939BN07_9FIRM|nr:helix-turn-helix domain-containing protein [Halanaerobacter jeridensis]MBM7557900.1 cytoskeletal protein RodZ [Halanaerobacter jeridensis]
MKELGIKFKEKREKLDIPLAQARNETKIRMTYLKAIEEGNFEEVEREVYLKGFLKVYANYLGLDERKILQEYREYKKIKEQENQPEEQLAEDKNKKTIGERIKEVIDEHQNKFLYAFMTGIILLIIVAVLFLGTMIYNSFSSGSGSINWLSNFESYINKIDMENQDNNSSQTEIDSTTENDNDNLVTENQSKPEQEESKVNKDNNQPQEVKNSKESEVQNLNNDQKMKEEVKEEQINLTVKAIANSWCVVEINGDSVFKGTLKKGTTKSFKGKNIKLKIGNGAGIKIVKNGQELGPFGKAGEVVVKEYSIKSD